MRQTVQLFTFFPFRSSGNARTRSCNSVIIRFRANRSFIFTLLLYFSTLSYRLVTPPFFTLGIADCMQGPWLDLR